MAAASSRLLRAFSNIQLGAGMVEETRSGRRDIFASLISQALVTSALFGMACALTLLVPFDRLSTSFTVPQAFAAAGIPASRYVLSVGAVCVLAGAAIAAALAAPRLLDAMARDGLMFKPLSRLVGGHDCTTPLLGQLSTSNRFFHLIRRCSGTALSMSLTTCFSLCSIDYLQRLCTVFTPLRFLLCVWSALLHRYGCQGQGPSRPASNYRPITRDAHRSILSAFNALPGDDSTATQDGSSKNCSSSRYIMDFLEDFNKFLIM